MTSPQIYPRPDQIAELTRGLQLPLPEIDQTHLEILLEGVAQAFAVLSATQPATMSGGSETEVTSLMAIRLNAYIDEDPLWGQLVHSVSRGSEVPSYNAAHLEKRPDLSIHLTGRVRNFPLVGEAKVIDAGTGKTEKLYCDKGLCRFTTGEYAWATREAFMLAYVRDGSSIASKLTPHLSADLAKTQQVYLVEELPQGTNSPSLARSRHKRSFLYTHQPAPDNAPGSIDLWHIWLS